MYNQIAKLIIIGFVVGLATVTIGFANGGGFTVEELKEGGQQYDKSVVTPSDQSFVPTAPTGKVADNDKTLVKETSKDSGQVEVYSFKEGEGEQKVK